MRRYVANYTILADGEELINHIITVGDEGEFISVEAFDRELANTRYVPAVLCLARATDRRRVDEVFKSATSRKHFAELLCQDGMAVPQKGEKALVLCLDFRTKIINEI